MAAKAAFMQKNIKLPMNWQQPSGNKASLYDGAFQPSEKMTAPGVPPMFQPATLNKYHTDTQKQIGQKVAAYIDGITSAICSAWSTWQSAATIVGVTIMGPTAAGGQVVGPPLTPLILGSGPKASPNEMKYTNAVANVIGTAWLQFTATIKVPGLPWYPAFAAVPSPVAPPAPNIPANFMQLVSVDACLQPSTLSSQMAGMLGDPQALHHKDLFDAIADGFNKMFMMWKSTTMVMNVIGTGPVPTFAPPYVPVGPVVGGQGTMTPGGFV